MGDTITIKGLLLLEREKALLLRFADFVATWVPRSVCVHISKGPPTPAGREATVEIELWFAEQKNLTEYET